MKKSSPSNNDTIKNNPTSLSEDICPVCEKETPKEMMACQNCHAEIHHLRGKALSDEQKKEINSILKHLQYSHVLVVVVFITSWILVRLFLWT